MKLYLMAAPLIFVTACAEINQDNPNFSNRDYVGERTPDAVCDYVVVRGGNATSQQE